MHYGMHHGPHCGYDPCHYGYGYQAGGYGHHWFALIVVLFILLIIIGATCYVK